MIAIRTVKTFCSWRRRAARRDRWYASSLRRAALIVMVVTISAGMIGGCNSVAGRSVAGRAAGPDAAAVGLSVEVRGTELVDGAGTALQLRGVSASGLESVAMQGWNHADPWGGWQPVWKELQAWHVNVVRLPLNEASWLGYTCIDGNGAHRNPDPGGNYRSTVERTVSEANAAGIYVILDLQWSAPGNYCPLGQNQMADADHAPAFWTSVATTFKNDRAVLFELFNEPFIDDWNVWLGGGMQTTIKSPLAVSYAWRSAGEQQLLEAVRATGAGNVVLIGGLGYSNDLTGWPGHAPRDPRGQLAAAWHVYADNRYISTVAGSTTVNMLSAVAALVPVVITEVGDADGPGATGDFVTHVMNFADDNAYSYLAWTWNHWGQAANDLILDDAGTPTIGFGASVKRHYLCRATRSPC
jgi:hypothetical protein